MLRVAGLTLAVRTTSADDVTADNRRHHPGRRPMTSSADDPYRLARFVEAQTDTYAQALTELRTGHKTSHWMWFVFPQVAGLGRSATAQRFAISGLDEARAYLAHPVLGPRLVESAQALTELPGSDAAAVLGPVDAVKLRSSMTLFAHADPGQPVFRAVLEQYFGGEEDDATTSRL
ncbi:DUF1810 domain-containing protein [Geodermatophilus arenarius]